MSETSPPHALATPPGPAAPHSVPYFNCPTAEDVTEAWRNHGGFVLLDVVPPETCDALTEALNAQIVAADAADHRAPWPTGFATRLLASADSVVPFWDPTVSTTLPPTERLMRLGHQLQQVPEVAQVLRRPEFLGCLGLLLKSAEIVDCVLIDKVPRGTVQFGTHQDSWYLLTDPDTLVSVQIALDDADGENGGLLLQGTAERDAATCRGVPGTRGWRHTREKHPPPPSDKVPQLTMPRGSVLIYHGLAWHGSLPNRSNRHRRVIVAQFKDASSRWSDDNWLKPPPGGFPSWR